MGLGLRSILVFVGITLLASSEPAQEPVADLPYRLKIYIQSGRSPSLPYNAWWPIDYDADGLQELLIFRDNRTLQVCSPGQKVWTTAHQYNLRGPATVHTYYHACTCGDLTGDGRNEIAVPRAEGDSLWVDVYDVNGVLLELGPWPNPDSDDEGLAGGTRDSKVQPIGTLRAPDGEPLLIVLANAGKDMGMRAVQAYSLQSGEERWRFPTGSNPIAVATRFADLDDDGLKEIVFTMPSPSNGRATELTDDAHAWLVVLGVEGQLRWLRKLGPHFHHPTWCDVFWPEADRPLIVTCISNRQSSAPDSSAAADGLPIAGLDSAQQAQPVATAPDTLCVWDARTGQRLHAQGWEFAFQDMVKLDERRFVVTAAGGLISLHELSSSGKVRELAQRQTDPPVRVRAVADLNEDGHRDLLGSSFGFTPHLVVLDENLAATADLELYRGAGQPEFGVVHGVGGRPLLLAGIEEHLLTLEMLPNPAFAAGAGPAAAEAQNGRPGTTPDESGVEWKLVVLMLGLAAATVTLFVFIRRRHSRADSAAAVPSPAGSIAAPHSPDRPTPTLIGNRRQMRKDLLLATEVGSHGGLSTTRVIRRVLWLMEWVSDQSAPSQESVGRLRAAVRDYHEITLPQIEDILALGAALQIDAEVTRQVQVHCEEFRQSLTDLADAEWPAAAIREALPAGRAAADRIEQGLQAIRRVARKFVAQRLLPEVESAVAAVAEGAERLGADIRVDLDAETRACIVRAGRGDLAVILENLLANALRAMHDSRERSIRIVGRTQGRFALVEVQDTGRGIPRDQWERVFEAGVSSRPGGGTGLYASRRLLEGLGGALRVKASEVDVGTTMELRLLLDPAPADDAREASTPESDLERSHHGL